MAFVVAYKTPVTADALRACMRDAFTSLLGFPPSENQLTLMVAQSAFETAHWRSIYNYNVGNIKLGRSSGDRTSYPCGEVIGGEHQKFPAGHQNCIFRSYDSLKDGVVDYLSVLLKNEQWKEGLLTGDPHEFTVALSTGKLKYFTADPAHYERVLTSVFHKYHPKSETDELPTVPSNPIPPTPIPPSPLPPADLSGPLPPQHPAGGSRVSDEPWAIAVGSSGFTVELLQRLLNLRMAPPDQFATYRRALKVDGKYGPLTQERVTEALRCIGLSTATITVPKALWQSLCTVPVIFEGD